MPRTPRFPPYPEKKHASGQARIKIHGRTVYLGVHGTPESWREYERLLSEWRLAQTEGPAPAPGQSLTVAEVCTRFMTHATSYYRHPDGTPTSELDGYRQGLRPLIRLYGHVPVTEFGPLALKAVRQAMTSGSWMRPEERTIGRRAENGGSWSRKLVNQHVGRVKRVWKWAASEELLPVESYAALATVRGLAAGRSGARELPDVPPVADSVVEATLPHLGPVVRAMVQLQRLAGMRPGEVCGLTAGEVDREGLAVDGVPVWVYRPSRHKTNWRGHRKAVAIGPKAQAVLVPYLEGRQPDEPVFRPCDQVEAQLVTRSQRSRFPCRRGKNRVAAPKRRPGLRWTTSSYSKAIAKACRRHGLPHWHPGQLRHTAASQIQHEFSLDAARAVLGHRDAKVTTVYAAHDLETAAKVASQLG